jgi:hypothetical protein
MTGSSEMFEFVQEALTRGASRAQVQEALLQAGWSRDMVHGALAEYADVEFVIPVPKPKPYLSARDAFLYLLLFSTLYITAFNLGALVFQFIDRAFPDAAVQGSVAYTRDAIRWAISSLIIAFPVFLYLSVIVARSVRQDPIKQRSSIRRWLMYLTVFLAASILIGDFITLVYNALGGELTPRFVLKVLAIATIAGTIFGYYLSDLKLEDTKPAVEGVGRNRALASVVAVVAAVAAGGLFLAGAPSDERARRLDARRVEDLQRISASTNVYFHRHGRLPSSVEELSREGGSNVDVGEPSKGPYEYRVRGERAYELCATFQRDSAERRPRPQSDFWSHGPGRNCFQLEVKKVG